MCNITEKKSLLTCLSNLSLRIRILEHMTFKFSISHNIPTKPLIITTSSFSGKFNFLLLYLRRLKTFISYMHISSSILIIFHLLWVSKTMRLILKVPLVQNKLYCELCFFLLLLVLFLLLVLLFSFYYPKRPNNPRFHLDSFVGWPKYPIVFIFVCDTALPKFEILK